MQKGGLNMKGYKVFSPNWSCRGYQFEVGKTFEENVKPECRDKKFHFGKGFHFCTKISDCFSFYRFDPNNKVAEVEAVGDIVTNPDNTECYTNKLRVIREISWLEVLEMANTGDWNSGLCNSGDHNTGDYNSGDRNTGDYNSGNYNSGDCNSGDRNTGDYNTGDYNTGDYNSGNHNSGYCNTGNCNSGNYNSGSHNTGDYNNGDWNKTSFSNGCFNTKWTKPAKIYLFDKPSDWTYQDWLLSEARDILMDCPSSILCWVDEEREQYPEHPATEHPITGGFLKHDNKEDERQMWWDSLPDKQKQAVLDLPNFDKNIFKYTTGIRA